MHPAAEAGEMVFGMLALAVAGEPIPCSGRSGAAPWPFVSGIGPEPGGLGLASAGGEHADRRVIGKDRFGRQDMATNGVSKGFQQGCGLADPVSQRGTVKIKAFAVEDLALPVKRQMIGILADQHVSQQTRPRTAPLDGPRGQRRLNKLLAAGASQPGANDPVHDKPAGDVFQFVDHILTDPAQAATAIGTGIGSRAEFHLHPRDVVRDRAALGFVLLLDVRQLHPRRHRGGSNLAGLQRQLQLFRCLRRGPEPVRPVSRELMSRSSFRSVHWTARSCCAGQFLTLDQDRLSLHLGQKPRGEAAQLLGVFGQGHGLIEHAGSLSHCIPCGNPSLAGRQIIPLPEAATSAAAPASRYPPAASTIARASAPPCPPWPRARRTAPFPAAS